jgi:hypothetical protein
MLKIGRCLFAKDKPRFDPEVEGFTPITVLTETEPEFWELSPFYLTDEKKRNMENIWQFSKVYKKVPHSKQRGVVSYNEKTNYATYGVVWEHPGELHVKNGNLTKEYKAWRKRGMFCKYPIRYPVGFQHRSECLYAIKNRNHLDEHLDYIEARKAIYMPVYCKLVKQQQKFKDLRKRLQDGENLLIIEVDGPHSKSLQYYKNTYGVGDDFISDNGVVDYSLENMKLLLNDPKHNFGHGYCLALALMGDDENVLTMSKANKEKAADDDNDD